MTVSENVLPVGRCFRTLEERFLAEYAALEEERDRLAVRNAALETAFAERSANIRLDAMVRVAGRQKLGQEIFGYRWTYPPTVSHRAYEEWVLRLIEDLRDKPEGVSDQELADYFEPELVAMFERLVGEEEAAG